MKNKDAIYQEHISVYPGEYQPMNEMELNQGLTIKEGRRVKPPVTIHEQTFDYRIEIPVPGFKVEDLFVHTDGAALSITGKKKIYHLGAGEDREQSFRMEYIDQYVALPADADSAFGTAVCKNDILHIYLFKGRRQTENQAGEIFVY